MEEEQRPIPTWEFDSHQVKIQKWESKLVQKWSSNQKIDVHALFLLTECDHKILVMQFHSVLV